MLIKMMSFLDDFLSQNHITLDKIDNVILVGGCIKIPKIYSLILSFFHGKNILKSLNPDEANAIGNSLFDMIKIKVFSENPGKTLYNLGVRSEGNLMSV